jgi:Yip1 domain
VTDTFVPASTAPSPAAHPAGKALPARILGVLLAPRATYAGIGANPRWFGVLAFVALFGALGTFIFLSTEVGQTAALDQNVRMMESFGRNIPDEAYARMEQGMGRAKYIGPVFQAVFVSIAAVVIAGLAFAVFTAVMGGAATFKQVFAIVAHSGVVLSLSQLFGLPLAYARESMSGATNLGVFAPFLEEGSFVANLLGSIDLFIIWWTISLAIGLGVLYKRRTQPIAISFIVIYVTIGVIIAAIKAAYSGA